MSVIQDTYLDKPGRAYAGMPLNSELSNRISRTIEDAAGLAFGAPAFRGSGDNGCTGTPSADFLGVVIADHGLAILPGGTADTFPQYDGVGLMNKGAIAVTTAEAVTPGDPVYVTPAKTYVTAASGNTALAGWEFDETGAIGDVVAIVKR